MIKKLLFFLFTIFMSVNMIATEVTITPENSGWATTAGAQNGTVECVSISVTNGLADGQLRVYKGETLTISSDSTITSIVFTCTANGTTKYGPGCFAAQEGYTYETSGKTGTWTGSAKSVTFTASSNQVRATQIVVTINCGSIDTIPTDTTSQDTTTIIPSDTTAQDTSYVVPSIISKDSIFIYDYSEMGYTNQQDLDNVEIKPNDTIHVTFSKAEGTSGPKYYTTGTGIRTYGNNVIAVSSLVDITEITFAFTQNDKDYSVDCGEYSKDNAKWVGKSKYIEFTAESGSGHNRIKSMSFKYEIEEIPVVPTDITNIETKAKGYKVFDGKQILIIKNGKTFNVLGQRLD